MRPQYPFAKLKYMEVHCTHTPQSISVRPLLLALIITSGFMVLEFVGGILSGSLALLSDAGHMLTDTAALGLSLSAVWLARRPADPKRTYGYYRIEILAALLNCVFLWVMVFFIFREAFQRLTSPTEVNVQVMMLVGTIGLFVNVTSIYILHTAQKESLNVRAAFLHVLGDALGSVGVVVAGAIIMFTGWTVADPIAGMVIGVLILYSSWGLMKEAVHILLEGVPEHIDIDEIREEILSLECVRNIHDLHIWTLTPKVVLLTVHVITEDEEADPDPIRRKIRDLMAERFCIEHTTIQIERKHGPGDEKKPVVRQKNTHSHEHRH